jgi:hypothetical protein
MRNDMHVDTKLCFHQQDKGNYCGPAVAQMVLDQLGIPLAMVCQNGLNGQIPGSATNNGGTQPTELCYLLNLNRPRRGSDFALGSDGCAAAGCRRIVRALAHSGIAVPALVFGDHWIAVTGAVYDASDPFLSVQGFFINNPEPTVRSSNEGGYGLPPPPHAAGDTCGQGGHYFGSADTYVTTYAWLTEYWDVPFKNGNFVTITKGSGFGDAATGGARQPRVTSAPREITADDAICIAMSGIAEARLDRLGPLACKLAGARPSRTPPIMCSKLGAEPDIGAPDFIVFLQKDDEVDYAAFARVALTGEFLGVQAPPAYVPSPNRLFDLASAAVEAYALRSNRTGVSSAVRQRLFTTHPTLVWRPCRQSMSPFSPFVQINIAGAVLYLAGDGRIYTQLDAHG